MEKRTFSDFSAIDYEGLHSFLSYCQQQAVTKKHFQLVSISIEVNHIDPLAVLESIYDSETFHFYLERKYEGIAVAGIEHVLKHSVSGEDRFSKIDTYCDEILEHSISIGGENLRFAGPCFYYSFTFEDSLADNSKASTVFVPRWQVSKVNHQYVAVANVVIDSETNIEEATKKIWAAHQKFTDYNYAGFDCSEKHALSDLTEKTQPSDQYETIVKAALEKIKNKEFEKIVLARKRTFLHKGKVPIIPCLSQLREVHPSSYTFSFSYGSNIVFLGSTPERLVDLKEGRLETAAIAGTEKRGMSPTEDAQLAQTLLSRSKDIAEHAFVVKSITEKLASIGIDAELSSRPELLQLSNVQHLITPITADVDKKNGVLDIAGVLHPTAAIAGFPVDVAKQNLSELEDFERGPYSGVVGWRDANGDGLAVVGIRSALIQEGEINLFAGAGIVKDSKPEVEKLETNMKFNALLDVIKAL